MASSWLDTLKSAQKTCLVQDGKKKVHYTLVEGSELAEEYDLNSGEILVRKWRRKGTLGGSGSWEFEVGEQLSLKNVEVEGMVESNTNPIFVRKDKKDAFQWRVRNLPYPLDTYDVQVDAPARVIIIRTTNKKYYKKFGIPDMDRAGLTLDQSQLSLAHANNTLIITYKKPPEILTLEKQVWEEINKTKANKDGDVECSPS